MITKSVEKVVITFDGSGVGKAADVFTYEYVIVYRRFGIYT
jgi:hypothetical protein